MFLSGANIDGDQIDQWDGSGTAIIRAPSMAAATAIAEAEPCHREGLRINKVHGWMLNEGTVRLTLSLFTGKATLG
ncbi:uncharacterized protein YciI [Streptomyces pseudovenezuelae]|uniref:Uncharacterized protein YciI n=1 Tax=Streptomyces pseudovenezuelae TaxID=67350 RepID=A0ABT6LZ84_9ACTN|nr:hypothetical protein [Streptomyces pseudovenezuelae]MDH6221119.1 uncharacterized protein YciI [Streptomyces pseudovenezuelae]